MSFNISPLSLSIQTRLPNKRLQIPSRFYLAPINTGFAPNGKPNAKFIEFYKKRSGKYIGITYIGNVSIDKAWRTNSNTPWLSPETLEIWEDLSSVINKNGSLPGIQLACRQSSKEPFKGWKRDDAKFFIDKLRTQFSKIPKDEIRKIKESFISSALQSLKLGFKVIQIHAAHGYFLSQLLDTRINIRDDYYGSNPLIIINDIISCIKNEKSDSIVDLRLSLFDGLEDSDKEFERKSILIEKITNTKIDIISISNGTYDFNKNFIYPPIEWGHGPFIKNIIPLARKYPNIVFNIAGNIWDIRKIPTNIPDNLSFSIGRALIADPELIEKSISGRYDEILWCVRKGSCHYYTKEKTNIYCPFDPDLTDSTKRDCECSKLN